MKSMANNSWAACSNCSANSNISSVVKPATSICNSSSINCSSSLFFMPDNVTGSVGHLLTKPIT
jgi:hypothetical protein